MVLTETAAEGSIVTPTSYVQNGTLVNVLGYAPVSISSTGQGVATWEVMNTNPSPIRAPIFRLRRRPRRRSLLATLRLRRRGHLPPLRESRLRVRCRYRASRMRPLRRPVCLASSSAQRTCCSRSSPTKSDLTPVLRF
jgi:hypothetical protein